MGKQHETFPGEKPEMPVPEETPEIKQPADRRSLRYRMKPRRSYRTNTRRKTTRPKRRRSPVSYKGKVK